MSEYTNGRRADSYEVLGVVTDENGEAIVQDQSLMKDVAHLTTVCPECRGPDGERVAAWKDKNDDAICPKCGMVCSDEVEEWPSDLSHGLSQTETGGNNYPAASSSKEVVNVRGD